MPRRVICNRGPNGNPPGWLFRPPPCELAYAAWGFRRYGEAPIEPALHEGWHYFVVLAGTPTLLIGGETVIMRPGMGTLCHPDCPVGNIDTPGRRCRVLIWIWRTPPRHSALQPSPRQPLSFLFTPPELRKLEHVHRACREAASRSTERGMLELHAARIDADLCFLDAAEQRAAKDNDIRLELAINFLRSHLKTASPVRELQDYLQVSATSLKELFHRQAGTTPRSFAAAWRMQWAREQLASRRASVKSVSYSLGYRHTNDFSRAFKKHFGRSPREATRGSVNPEAAG